MPRKQRGGKFKIPQSSSCPRQSVCLAGLQEVDTKTQVLSDGEQLDLSKEASTTENSVDKNVASVSEQLNLAQEIPSPTCPQQSVEQAELQDNSDESTVSVPKNAQESDLVTEAKDIPQMKESNDMNNSDLALGSNEMVDLPKQTPDFQAPGSIVTELVAKRLTRSDSLETFTGGDDSPSNNSSEFLRMKSKPLPQYQRRFARKDRSPENEWVCIVTKKHPERRKPQHFGRI